MLWCQVSLITWPLGIVEGDWTMLSVKLPRLRAKINCIFFVPKTYRETDGLVLKTCRRKGHYCLNKGVQIREREDLDRGVQIRGGSKSEVTLAFVANTHFYYSTVKSL